MYNNPYKFSIYLFLLLLLPAACSSPSVLYDYDTKARFPGYQTFSWLESDTAPLLIDVVDQLIRDSISAQLETRGIQYVGSGGDLLVAYHPGQDEPIYPSRYGYAYWPSRWGYGGYYQGVEQYEYARGALVIDLIDRPANQLVWRGSAPGVLRTATTDKLTDEIGEAIRLILKHYPPAESY